MSLNSAEKFVRQLLISAPDFSLPATEILAAARTSNAGSPATIQRAGARVATKKRQAGASQWTLRQEHRSSPPVPAVAQEASPPDVGPYDGWSFDALRSEAERRGYKTCRDTVTEAELELILYGDDTGWFTPDDFAASPARHGVSLPY